MLDVTARSQRGRICILSREGTVLETPAVLPWGPAGASCVLPDGDGRTVRICGGEVPADAKILTGPSSGAAVPVVSKDGIAVLRLPVRGDETVPDDCETVVIPNGFEIKGGFRMICDQIAKAREVAGYGRALAVLGLADPSDLALLVYMGVDIVDESFVRTAGMNGFLVTAEGTFATGGDESAANAAALREEMSRIRMFIAAGRLRELADQRSFQSAANVALLRVFDDEFYAYQEEAFAVNGGRFSCNSTQALMRPDIVRYTERMRDRYAPPAHKRILLLLPCSAKKPYHISKSHRMFSSAVHTGPWDTLVHEVVVTSPLGIVPRELDAFYPASSYDIPVTGRWKPEEKDRIAVMLADLMSKGRYDRVISHLGGDDALVGGICPGMVRTCVGDPVSPASLKNLEDAVRGLTKGYAAADWSTDRKECARCALRYQFGADIADALLDGASVTGKYPYWKVVREDGGRKVQVCMMSAERGMFSLGPEGAGILADRGMYTVETRDDFRIKGSLYAVGISRADHAIREGDEAVIVHNGELRGVGTAVMCGREMEQSGRGVAVKMRHARRSPLSVTFGHLSL